MNLIFILTIIVLIFQSCFSVHPGDPFPVHYDFNSNIHTSDDQISTNELDDSIDDEVSSLSETRLIDSFEPKNYLDNAIDDTTLTSTKSTLITKLHTNEMRRKSHTSTTTKLSKTRINENNNQINSTSISAQETTTMATTIRTISSSVKSFYQKNKSLVQIARWKYKDPKTKQTRYWYEPEGGNMGRGWTFDRFVFKAYNRSEPGTEPVYGFHSETRAVWTNTVQMDPKPPIIGNDQWIPDGVLFYAYRTSMNSSELQPIVRYWNKLKPGATDATETRITYIMVKEADSVVDDKPEWMFDQVLFYAFPIEF